MTKTVKVYQKFTEDSMETLSLTVSDGLIALYSDDEGKDLAGLIKNLLVQMPDELDPRFKDLADSKREMKFLMRVEVNMMDIRKPDSTVSTDLFMVGAHQNTLHGVRNSICVYEESEVRALPEFTDIDF